MRALQIGNSPYKKSGIGEKTVKLDLKDNEGSGKPHLNDTVLGLARTVSSEQ